MHKKIAVGVLRDLHILWQGFLSFVHNVRFHSACVNVILFTIVRRHDLTCTNFPEIRED
jgi:hypothetical protein